MDFQFLFDWLMNGFINFANGVIDAVTTILPTSPFDAYIVATSDVSILKILNYFCPIGAYVTITLAWAEVLLLFYGEAIVIRWVKIVKG